MSGRYLSRRRPAVDLGTVTELGSGVILCCWNPAHGSTVNKMSLRSGRRNIAPGGAKRNPGECSAQYREPAQRATDTENKKWHCGPPPATRASETFGEIPRVPLRSTRGYIPPPAS